MIRQGMFWIDATDARSGGGSLGTQSVMCIKNIETETEEEDETVIWLVYVDGYSLLIVSDEQR